MDRYVMDPKYNMIAQWMPPEEKAKKMQEMDVLNLLFSTIIRRCHLSSIQSNSPRFFIVPLG
jgi:hypothetical protein